MDTNSVNNEQIQPIGVETPADKIKSVVLDKKVFPVDDKGRVDLKDERIPKILISELPEGISFEVWRYYFRVKFDPADRQNVSFSTYRELNVDPSILSYRALARIVSLSTKAVKRNNPSIRNIDSDSSDFVLSLGFTARIEAETLREVFKSAEKLVAEVLAPVIEIENLFSKSIQDLKKKASK